ncbi:trypsin delta-like [Episyrphus balteatus]|uniref:trypsin delta-like n=1 Tax=Episyrphus balteatus TaxID=286459 RepID=UPI0024851AAC|nr:trypsin delta-like [Episyrphus balteatus]
MLRLIVALSVVCLVAGLDSAENLNNTDRVVNGRGATALEFPYQVSIEQDGNHFCGGSIVNPSFILTAAHCLYDLVGTNTLHKVAVRAGTSTRQSGGIMKRAEFAAVHPQYQPRTFICDVAVLKILGQFIYSAVIKPVELAILSYPTGISVTLSGWGKTHDKITELPYQMQSVELSLFSTSDCSSPRFMYGNDVRGPMLCAAGHGTGSCQGDSGGPLVVSGTNTQVGIVSFGKECAHPGYPGVYTKVSDPAIMGFIRTYVK